MQRAAGPRPGHRHRARRGHGLAALFLYLDTTAAATTGATQQILFGSIFVIDVSTVPVVVAFGAVALALLAILYRPLLLSSLSPDLAAARGVPVRLVGLAYMLALALAVGLSSLAIGAILSTALLVGPAGHRPAPHQAEGAGPGRRRPSSAWPPPGSGIAPGLRQLLLGRERERLAGQLLHRGPGLRRLPGADLRRRAPAADRAADRAEPGDGAR